MPDPVEQLSLVDTLLDLGEIDAVRKSMPTLLGRSEELIARGFETNLLLTRARYLIDEAQISHELAADLDDSERSAGDEKTRQAAPEALERAALALTTLTKQSDLDPTQQARRLLLRMDYASIRSDWADIETLFKDVANIPCTAPATLLWRIGTKAALAAFQSERRYEQFATLMRHRSARAVLHLPVDDPALLELLEINAYLAVESKDASAAETAIADLRHFQQHSVPYNHLWGTFRELGELLSDLAQDETAFSAFEGAFEAQKVDVPASSAQAADEVMLTVRFYAFEASASLKKELYRHVLADKALVSANNPGRPEIEIALADAFSEDGLIDAAKQLLSSVYSRHFERVMAEESQSRPTCGELLEQIDNDIDGTRLTELARRQVAYTRCVLTDPLPIGFTHTVLTAVLAQSYQEFGAEDRARGILQTYRARLPALDVSSDEDVSNLRLAFKMAEDGFAELSDAFEAQQTRTMAADRMMQINIARAYSLLETQPGRFLYAAVRMKEAHDDATTLGRQSELLAHYVRASDVLVAKLRQHADENVAIISTLKLLLEEATKLARAGNSNELAAQLATAERELIGVYEYGGVCRVLSQIRFADANASGCFLAAPSELSVAGEPIGEAASEHVTKAALGEAIASVAASERRRDIKDWQRRPTASEVDQLLHLIGLIESEPTEFDTQVTISDAAGVTGFVRRVAPFTDQRRRVVETLARLASTLEASNVSKALLLRSAVVSIQASYTPTRDLYPVLSALSSRLRQQTDLQVHDSTRWIGVWERAWHEATAPSNQSLAHYEQLKSSLGPRAAQLQPAIRQAFRDLVRAYRFDDARRLFSEWQSIDENVQHGYFDLLDLELAFPRGIEATCAPLSAETIPILRECLETYVYMHEQMVSEGKIGGTGRGLGGDLMLLAAMTVGDDQQQLVQATVRMADHRSAEASVAATSLLRRFRARMQSPQLHQLVQSYEAALRGYRKLDGEIILAGRESDESLKATLIEARANVSALRRQVDAAHAEAEALDARDLFDLTANQRVLQPEEAVLGFYIEEDSALGILITSSAAFIRPLGSDRSSIRRAVNKLRTAELGEGLNYFDRAFDVATAHALYLHLIEPFAEQLSGISHLLIEPGAELYALPFNALVAEQPKEGVWNIRSSWTPNWLVSRFAITFIPQLSVFVPLRDSYTPSGARQTLMVGGDPVLKGALSVSDASFDAEPRRAMQTLRSLSGASAEIAALKREFRLPDKAVLSGEQFTEGRWMAAELHEYRAILLVTHAVGGTRQQPPYIVFTPDEADPQTDSVLFPSEAAQLSLDADLVMLSACRTGSEGLRGGDYNSLVSALVAAGARSVIATHWLVSSEVTGRISSLVLRQALDKRTNIAEALKQAALREIGSSGEHRHPAFWAPFFVWGISK